MYARINGQPLPAEWDFAVERSSVLTSGLGLPAMAALKPRLLVPCEEQVRELVQLWARTSASTVAAGRAKRAKAENAQPRHVARVSFLAVDGPRSWVPPLPSQGSGAEPPLKSEALQLEQQLVIHGSAKARGVARQMAGEIQRETLRAAHNLTAWRRKSHLIPKTERECTFHCLLCSRTAPKGEIIRFGEMRCLRAESPDYIEVYKTRWAEAMGADSCPVDKVLRRISHKSGVTNVQNATAIIQDARNRAAQRPVQVQPNDKRYRCDVCSIIQSDRGYGVRHVNKEHPEHAADPIAALTRLVPLKYKPYKSSQHRRTLAATRSGGVDDPSQQEPD